MHAVACGDEEPEQASERQTGVRGRAGGQEEVEGGRAGGSRKMVGGRRWGKGCEQGGRTDQRTDQRFVSSEKRGVV